MTRKLCVKRRKAEKKQKPFWVRELSLFEFQKKYKISMFDGLNMSETMPAKRQKCEETSVDDLPDEVFHEIFTLLDNDSLKNCAIVNKR